MNNYKITIQYDGTDFHGWQIQENALTVQEVVEKAVSIVFREKILLTGSGRTDSGVHALGQVANFKSIIKLPAGKLQHSLNSLLPETVSIKKIEKEGQSFNSRYYAKQRSYIYLFVPTKDPFFRKYAWHNRDCLHWDIEKLNKISKVLLGKFEFTAFCKVGSSTKDHICGLQEIRWRRTGKKVIFYIQANRFLRGMVRLIIGTILEAYEKENPEEYLFQVLESKNNQLAGAAAPAEGLFLYKVKY